MTQTPPPAPFLGQFITETTEVTAAVHGHRVVQLDPDGSRRIVARHVSGGTAETWAEQRERLLGIGQPMVFWGLLQHPGISTTMLPGRYLPYPPADGIPIPAIEEPVNQVPFLIPYREHAARYAHQLDDAMGHHTLQSSSEEDRLTVFQSLSAMIGVAAMKYQEWSEVDPEALIVGGNFDGTLEWKRFLTYYEGVDANLCGQCDIATFARRFLFHADLPAFRRLYRQGIIYSADRSTDPWSPAIFDAATPPADEYFDKLDEYYHLMLEYYDNEVGLSN